MECNPVEIETPIDAEILLSTRERYLQISEAIGARAKQDLEVIGREIDPREIAAHFIGQLPGYTKATARLYKAALIFAFERDGSVEALKARDQLRDINNDGGTFIDIGSELTERRTSASKAKKLSQEDLEQIIDAVRRSRSKWGAPAAVWLKAGLYTGLRPSEWIEARLLRVHGFPALIVKNAKNTRDRAHGDYRRINLDGLTEHLIQMIAAHLESIQTYARAGLYPMYYKECSRFIARCVRNIWPRRILHITLYSPRHQFCANAKSFLSKEEVAALMGHASVITAGRHYGLSAHGSGTLGVSPAAEDVQAVHDREQLRAAREAEYLADLDTSLPGFEQAA